MPRTRAGGRRCCAPPLPKAGGGRNRPYCNIPEAYLKQVVPGPAGAGGRAIFKLKKQGIPPDISGVRVRVSSRARRMSLRVEMRTGEVVLVFPPRGTEKSAARFIAVHRDWIENQRAKKTAAEPVYPGMALSLLGREYIVTHRVGRGATLIEGEDIVVRGDIAHFRRRLRDFLKKEAARVLTAAAQEKTERLGLKMHPVRLRDPKSRWGSCGRDGRLMFSWRLIFAPEGVLDYVVAHEVAHRRHMNHGPKFWSLCAALTDSDIPAARLWLRTNGPAVMRLLVS